MEIKIKMRCLTVMLHLIAVIITSPTWAADSITKSTINWEGVTVGINTGGSFTDQQRIITYGNDPFTALNMELRRRTPVIQTQYNYVPDIGLSIGYTHLLEAVRGVAIGLSADWARTGLDEHVLDLGEPVFPGTPRVPSAYRQRVQWIGTVTGRLGYVFDNLHVYGLAGLAYGKYVYEAQFYNPIFDNALAYDGRREGVDTGFAYGAGFEYSLEGITTNILGQPIPLAMKFEIMRFDLGSEDILVGGGYIEASQGSYGARFETKGTMLKTGLTYRFNGF